MTRMAERLAAALGRPGCPVCRLAGEWEADYWRGVLYERFQHAGLQRDVQAATGFCSRHVAQLSARRDAFAAAVLARAALYGAARLSDELARPRRTLRRRVPVPDAPRCPACVSLARTTDDALHELAGLLRSDLAVRERLEQSDGLCLDHLLVASAAGADPDRLLAARTRDRLHELRTEMDGLVASRDHRATPPTPEQAGRWRDAFRALRGDR